MLHLDRLWPPDQEATRKERWRWLMHHWPAQSTRELASARDAQWQDPGFLEDLSALVLLWQPEDIALFQTKKPAFLEEGLMIRKAHESLQQSDDTSARELLRKISLRSPFRDARLFLRGLSSYYAGEDRDAIEAFTRLEESWAYGAAARLLAGLCAPDDTSSPSQTWQDDLSGELRDALGIGQSTEPETIARVSELLQHKKPTSALREAGLRWSTLGAMCQQMLWRDLSGALLGLGLTPAQIISRSKQATIMSTQASNLFPLERCPVCRARMKGDEAIETPCRRCRADLQFVRACGYYATHWQAEARSALDQHDPTQALFAAVRAVSYVDAPATRATLEDAWQALQQTSSTPTHKAS